MGIALRARMIEPLGLRWRVRAYRPEADGCAWDDLRGLLPEESRLRAVLERVGPTHVPLLLFGEPGRGKTWVARGLHAISRPGGRLLEAEGGGLHAGERSLAAVLRELDGDTLLVRGLHGCPPRGQAELGEAIDAAPQGSGVVLLLDEVPDGAMDKGALRRDLYDRLLAIEVEALRCRREDIEPALRLFLGRAAERAGRPVPPIHEVTRARVCAYAWPGDVAELERLAARAVALGSVEEAIAMEARASAEMLGDEAALWEEICRRLDEGRRVPLDRVARRLVRRTEHELIERALRAVSGDRARAAAMLGINPGRLPGRTPGERP